MSTIRPTTTTTTTNMSEPESKRGKHSHNTANVEPAASVKPTPHDKQYPPVLLTRDGKTGLHLSATFVKYSTLLKHIIGTLPETLNEAGEAVIPRSEDGCCDATLIMYSAIIGTDIEIPVNPLCVGRYRDVIDYFGVSDNYTYHYEGITTDDCIYPPISTSVKCDADITTTPIDTISQMSTLSRSLGPKRRQAYIADVKRAFERLLAEWSKQPYNDEWSRS